MAQTTTVQDFAPLPQYSQTKTSNQTWVNVTTTRTDHDGSTTQHLQIIKR
ncbi:MAG: hypothetical protein F6K31_27505 [Symploca sp. SIO2G7]|nr:hypothetical protein [Symploca sp. SIO2G7]